MIRQPTGLDTGYGLSVICPVVAQTLRRDFGERRVSFHAAVATGILAW